MQQSEPWDILLVDDDELVRGGLAEWLSTMPEFRVVGQASNANQCLENIDKFRPQLALVDVILPGVSGIELVAKLKQSHPQIKCLILSGTLLPERVFDAFEAGAWGFLPKLTSAEEVGRALKTVAKSQWYLSPILAEDVLKKAISFRQALPRSEGTHNLLTDRERELLKLIAEGHTFTEIATQLSVSFRSVERMKQKLEEKLGVSTLVDLIRIAIRLGLINP